MSIIKKYLIIRELYIKDNLEVNKKLRKWILLLNPIVIALFCTALFLYYIVGYEKAPNLYNPILVILIISFLLSMVGTIVKRIKLMEKQDYINVKITDANLVKILVIYMCLGDILNILIKRNLEHSVGWLLSSNGSTYFGFIALTILICILIFIYKGREFFFEKSIKLITQDIKSGNIEIAKDSIRKNIKNKIFWGEEYIVIFNQLEELVKKLESNIVQANNKEQDRKELITNASHDIKTPLTSIISYSKILQNDNLTELEIDEYKEILVSKAKRISNLMHELKEAGKSDDEKIRVKIEKCNIKKVINNILDNNKERLNQKGLEVICKNFNDEVVCNIDITKTERVLQNLISNIYKYSKQGSKVKIDLKETESGCKIILQNESEKEIIESAENLLKRFTRGDKSRNTEGYGLGLNIAKRFMEEQDGELELYIEEKSFKVILTFSVG